MASPLLILTFCFIYCASQDVKESTSDDKISTFENWLANSGVTQILEIVEGAEGYGKITVAKQNIKVVGDWMC